MHYTIQAMEKQPPAFIKVLPGLHNNRSVTLWNTDTDENSALSERSERTLVISMYLFGICLLWNAP